MNFTGANLKNESTQIKIILFCILIASGVLVLRKSRTQWDYVLGRRVSRRRRTEFDEAPAQIHALRPTLAPLRLQRVGREPYMAP